MTIESITYTFLQVGTKIPHEHLGSVFSAFQEHMTTVWNIRLHVTLQQAVGSGLAGLRLIKRAINVHPLFPWDQVANILPTESLRVAAAFRAVGNDLYYGFKADLGPARSALYPRYVWICQTLLMRHNAGDERTLRDCQGGRRVVPNQDTLMQLIEAYVP
ncbi:unnamed protein product, partial [Ixodes pacificus]